MGSRIERQRAALQFGYDLRGCAANQSPQARQDFSVLYAQQSVAGTWTMSVAGISLQLAPTQDGEKISGTLESPMATFG